MKKRERKSALFLKKSLLYLYHEKNEKHNIIIQCTLKNIKMFVFRNVRASYRFMTVCKWCCDQVCACAASSILHGELCAHVLNDCCTRALLGGIRKQIFLAMVFSHILSQNVLLTLLLTHSTMF